MDVPDVPDAQRASSRSHLRYEDVCQDGRMVVTSLPQALGPVVWSQLLDDHPITHAARRGVLPILARLTLEGGEGPVSVGKPVSVDGGYQLAHTVDDQGQVNRLLLLTFARLTAPRARTQGPPPPGAGEPIVAGRVLSVAVFTRPFSPPAERKVLRFEFDGLPSLPPDRRAWPDPAALLSLPPAATPLDEALVQGGPAIAFGLVHTDSNQHVNSLVYPRLFEDAALRRFADLGLGSRLLARRVEVAYRKPCFVGDRARIWLRAFRDGPRLCAAGVFLPDGETPATARPYCYLKIILTE